MEHDHRQAVQCSNFDFGFGVISVMGNLIDDLIGGEGDFLFFWTGIIDMVYEM